MNSFDRPSVAASTRDVLVGLAAGDLGRPLSAKAVDWNEVFDEVCRNGLVGLTQRYLQSGVSASLPPAEFQQSIERGSHVSRLHMTAMYRWIASVVSRFSAADIPFMVLKGPALASLVYPDPSLRAFGDLDLMIRGRDMLAAHAALLKMGIVSDDHLTRIPPKLTSWCTTYERVYRDDAQHFVLEVHYDDLLNAGLSSRDLDGFWERSQTVNLPGAVVRTLAREDHLLHLCAHMHYHGYVKLNWFSDLAFLLREHPDRFDWDQVVRSVRVEEAEAPVFYSLKYLERLFGIAAPGEVLRAVAPDRLRQRVHRFYLPEDRVLSFQPMSRPDFSFYHLPVFKRLVPDLLVMGRRREKLRYLLRLLAPPADWLRHYYRLDAHQSVAVHYLLHPLKLCWHVAAEVAAISRKRGPWWSRTG